MGGEAHEDGSYAVRAREHKPPSPAFTENRSEKLHICILLKFFIITSFIFYTNQLT